jgi:predicted PurR-regulated permease PerM
MSWSKLAVTGLTIVGLLMIWMTHQIWAAAFLGVLFAVSLNGPAEWLRQYIRMPAWLSTLLVLVVVLAILTGLSWAIGPSFADEVDDLLKKLPDSTQKVLTWLDQRPWGRRMLQVAEDWSGMTQQQM